MIAKYKTLVALPVLLSLAIYPGIKASRVSTAPENTVAQYLVLPKVAEFPNRTNEYEAAVALDKQKAAQVTASQVNTPQIAVKQVPGNDVWASLRLCEAGGNYAANTGNGYYGAYQFDISTWNNYGGYYLPSDAPSTVQDAKAKATQAARGWSPWPSCSRKLGLF